MTQTTIHFSPTFYNAEAIVNLFAKLEINERVIFERRSPVRVVLFTKTKRSMNTIMKTLSPEASVLRVQYHVPSRSEQKRYSEWSAYYSIADLRAAYQNTIQ